MPGGARLAKLFGGRTLARMGSPRRIAAPAFAPSDQALKAAHSAGIERSEEKPVYSGGSASYAQALLEFPYGRLKKGHLVFYPSHSYPFRHSAF